MLVWDITKTNKFVSKHINCSLSSLNQPIKMCCSLKVALILTQASSNFNLHQSVTGIIERIWLQYYDSIHKLFSKQISLKSIISVV